MALRTAVASARTGASTLLVEKNSFFGGTANASMVGQFFAFFHHEKQTVFGIPYRCMLPRGVSNLLVTGRTISTDHDALASSRVMGPCMAEGQAAAAAAMLAVRNKSSLIDVDTEELRSELIADGARLT